MTALRGLETHKSTYLTYFLDFIKLIIIFVFVCDMYSLLYKCIRVYLIYDDIVIRYDYSIYSNVYYN